MQNNDSSFRDGGEPGTLPWFSGKDIEMMTIPVIERIRLAIDRGRIDEACSLCDLLKEERIVLHDLLADLCTALFTWVAREQGEDSIPEMFRYCFEKSARRQVHDLLALDIDRGYEAFMLAKCCWIAHSCSGAGEHGGSFRLIEDDEKFTFEMDPCGSGGRLWRKGRYLPPFSMKLTDALHPWSYGRAHFPVYCVHCAFLNEIIPCEYLGFSTWPVDPPENPEDVCRWHLYKDRQSVPGRYYRRLGLPASPHLRKKKKNSDFFTALQREDVCASTPERLRRRLARGERKKARAVCREMRGEFLFLHDLYVNMIASTIDFVVNHNGKESLNSLISFLYDTCLKTQIIDRMKNMNAREAVLFAVFNLFLADTSGGSGLASSRIKIEEDETSVILRLCPCSSGGKLRAGSAYKPLSRGRRVREMIENGLIRALVKLPLPRRLLIGMLPHVVTYFTETRKPENLGTVSPGEPWPAGQIGVMHYCALCVSLVSCAGFSGIEVTPPLNDGGNCIWRIDKKVTAVDMRTG